jgi:hypothetical protein
MPTKEELELYYQKIQTIRKVVAEDRGPKCPCLRANCVWHGNCAFCVRQHRLMGDHVSHCLQHILENKIIEIAKVAEMTVSKNPVKSPEYMDYVQKRDADNQKHKCPIEMLTSQCTRIFATVDLARDASWCK